jgi:hypothetical protein
MTRSRVGGPHIPQYPGVAVLVLLAAALSGWLL